MSTFMKLLNKFSPTSVGVGSQKKKKKSKIKKWLVGKNLIRLVGKNGPKIGLSSFVH